MGTRFISGRPGGLELLMRVNAQRDQMRQRDKDRALRYTALKQQQDQMSLQHMERMASMKMQLAQFRLTSAQAMKQLKIADDANGIKMLTAINQNNERLAEAQQKASAKHIEVNNSQGVNRENLRQAIYGRPVLPNGKEDLGQPARFRIPVYEEMYQGALKAGAKNLATRADLAETFINNVQDKYEYYRMHGDNEVLASKKAKEFGSNYFSAQIVKGMAGSVNDERIQTAATNIVSGVGSTEDATVVRGLFTMDGETMKVHTTDQGSYAMQDLQSYLGGAIDVTSSFSTNLETGLNLQKIDNGLTNTIAEMQKNSNAFGDQMMKLLVDSHPDMAKQLSANSKTTTDPTATAGVSESGGGSADGAGGQGDGAGGSLDDYFAKKDQSGAGGDATNTGRKELPPTDTTQEATPQIQLPDAGVVASMGFGNVPKDSSNYGSGVELGFKPNVKKSYAPTFSRTNGVVSINSAQYMTDYRGNRIDLKPKSYQLNINDRMNEDVKNKGDVISNKRGDSIGGAIRTMRENASVIRSINAYFDSRERAANVQKNFKGEGPDILKQHIGGLYNTKEPLTRPEAAAGAPDPSSLSKRVQDTVPSTTDTSGAPDISTMARNYKPLMDLIGGGEGGINSFNTGTAGDSTSVKAVDLFGKEISQMTLGEIKKLQDVRSSGKGKGLFAVGKHQNTPKTLRALQKYAGISDSAVYNERTQDALTLANFTKNRTAIHRYVTAERPTARQEDDALLAMAKEWASVGVPYDMVGSDGRGHKKQLKAGESYYKYWKGGNKATIDPRTVLERLDEVRANFKGKSITLESFDPNKL